MFVGILPVGWLVLFKVLFLQLVLYEFYWMKKHLLNSKEVTNLYVAQVLTGSELLSEPPLSSSCCRLSVGVTPGQEKTAGKMLPSQINEQ